MYLYNLFLFVINYRFKREDLDKYIRDNLDEYLKEEVFPSFKGKFSTPDEFMKAYKDKFQEWHTVTDDNLQTGKHTALSEQFGFTWKTDPVNAYKQYSLIRFVDNALSVRFHTEKRNEQNKTTPEPNKEDVKAWIEAAYPVIESANNADSSKSVESILQSDEFAKQSALSPIAKLSSSNWTFKQFIEVVKNLFKSENKDAKTQEVGINLEEIFTAKKTQIEE